MALQRVGLLKCTAAEQPQEGSTAQKDAQEAAEQLQEENTA